MSPAANWDTASESGRLRALATGPHRVVDVHGESVLIELCPEFAEESERAQIQAFKVSKDRAMLFPGNTLVSDLLETKGWSIWRGGCPGRDLSA